MKFSYLILTIISLFSSLSYSKSFNCTELNLDNIKSIYQAKESILVRNPYRENVCTGISFKENDDFDFHGYFKYIGVNQSTIDRLLGDKQQVAHAKVKNGETFQLLVYVTDGERGLEVANSFGEFG